MAERAIPVLDLSKFTRGSDPEKADFVNALGQAFHDIGFVGIKNHGISSDLIAQFYSSSKSFFALDKEVKKKYEIPGFAGQRGYTSFGKEHAKGFEVADLKEFYQLGQEVSDDDPSKALYPDNVHVKETPEFVNLGKDLYAAFEKVGVQLLEAIAIHLKLDTDYFSEKVEKGLSILRAIHYPPIISEPKSAIRAEQHEDINLITLLVGASAGGLQVVNKKGEWLNALPEADEIVINVGDMLQRLTNNYLKSTTHRVINPPREEWHKPRLSIPFFMHPKEEMDLTCLERCVTSENPINYDSITAGEYLSQRLQEIGLKK